MTRRALLFAAVAAAALTLTACSPAPPLPPPNVETMQEQVDAASRVQATSFAEAIAAEAAALTLLGDDETTALSEALSQVSAPAGTSVSGDEVAIPVGNGECAYAGVSPTPAASLRPC